MRIIRRIGLVNNGGRFWIFDNENGGDINRNTSGWDVNSGGFTAHASISADNITLYHKRDDAPSHKRDASVTTKGYIDLTNIKELNFYFHRTTGGSGGYGNVRISIIDQSGTRKELGYLGATPGTYTRTFNVSSYMGKYKIQLHMSGATNISQTTYNYIYKIWGAKK